MESSIIINLSYINKLKTITCDGVLCHIIFINKYLSEELRIELYKKAKELTESANNDNSLINKFNEICEKLPISISLIIIYNKQSIVLTSCQGHGLYFKQKNDKVEFSDVKSNLVDRENRTNLNIDSVVRYLHDDANISPLNGIFEGVHRIPGSCFAKFDNDYNFSIRAIIQGNEFTTRNRGNESRHHHNIDKVCSKIANLSNGRKIYLPISGGIDGLVLLAALVKAGGRVKAVYGFDGEYQNNINKEFVRRLRKLNLKGSVEYQLVTEKDVDPHALINYQRERLGYFVKGNYAKKNYKLALADFHFTHKEKREEFFCTINGYGIDELYMGGKGNADMSSIYYPTIFKTLFTFIRLGIASRVGVAALWLYWKICQLFGVKEEEYLKWLSLRLSAVGKSGGEFDEVEMETIYLFNKSLKRDAESVYHLLCESIDLSKGRHQLSLYIKSFIYYFVEQNHLVRFYNHGLCMGVPYILPYEDIDIRKSLIYYTPSFIDMWRPKNDLHIYLNKKYKINYEEILKKVGERRFNATRNFKKFLRSVLSKYKVEIHKKSHLLYKKTKNDKKSKLLSHVSKIYAPVINNDEVNRTLLSLLNDNYIESISKSIQEKKFINKKYSSKQVYNYMHIKNYLKKVNKNVN